MKPIPWNCMLLAASINTAQAINSRPYDFDAQALIVNNAPCFITSPKTFTPGTKMTFSGIADAKDRADLLAYLQTLSADPKPFPGAAAAPAAGEQPAAPAPAENAAPAPAENAAPAPATDTPSTTQGETNVEGTPTNSEAAPAENAAPAPTATPSAPAATPPAAPAPTTGQ